MYSVTSGQTRFSSHAVVAWQLHAYQYRCLWEGQKNPTYGAHDVVSSLNYDGRDVAASDNWEGDRGCGVKCTYILSISCFSSNWPSRMKPCIVTTIKHSQVNRLADKPRWWNSGFQSAQKRWPFVSAEDRIRPLISTYVAKSSFSARAISSPLTISFDVAILRYVVSRKHRSSGDILTPTLPRPSQRVNWSFRPKSSSGCDTPSSCHLVHLLELELGILPCTNGSPLVEDWSQLCYIPLFREKMRSAILVKESQFAGRNGAISMFYFGSLISADLCLSVNIPLQKCC